jgi:glutamyl-tRNA reductase
MQGHESKHRPDNEARHLLLVGFNYHRTPIAIRERAVIPESCLTHALHELKQLAHVKEAVVLSTCNRTEVYAVVSDTSQGMRELDQFFKTVQTINGHEPLQPNFRLMHDDVALHIFRVASGLDSLVLGEGQIMSQVKSAHRAALKASTIGPVLDQLFNMALRCGKRVRTETDISRRAASSSVSSAAIDLARQLFAGKMNKQVLIIGAGTVSKLCMKKLLHDKNSNDVITMLNRNGERFKYFTESRQSAPARLKFSTDYDERHKMAAKADLIIVGTSAPDFVLQAEEMRKLACGKEIAVIDLSVPRNVDPRIEEIQNIKVFHIDHLRKIVDWAPEKIDKVIAEAEKLVFEQLEQFNAWWTSLSTTATIIDFRKRFDEIRSKQILRSGSKNSRVDLEKLSVQMMNQFLHEPIVQLKATTDRRLLDERNSAIRTLFRLGS